MQVFVGNSGECGGDGGDSADHVLRFNRDDLSRQEPDQKIQQKIHEGE
jgi:hypothetical protein